MKPLQDETWKLAQEIVSRHYTPKILKWLIIYKTSLKMWTLLRKIVAFHFGYQGQVEDRDENDK